MKTGVAIIGLGVIALVAASYGAYFFMMRPKVLAPAPPVTAPKPVVIDHRHLAPAGTLFLLERASVTTATGVSGFGPGTKVTVVKELGNKMLVSVGATQLKVAADEVTNDIDLGALAGKHDAASQQEVARVLAQDAAAARAEQARHNSQHSAHLKEAESRPVIVNGASSKLDRPAYDQKYGVAHAPHIYDPRYERPYSYYPPNPYP